MKIKKGSVAIYVLALMLVTAGYWNYISHESQTIETVSMSQKEDDIDARDEHLGDATLVSNNELINEENANLENADLTNAYLCGANFDIEVCKQLL